MTPGLATDLARTRMKIVALGLLFIDFAELGLRYPNKEKSDKSCCLVTQP